MIQSVIATLHLSLDRFGRLGDSPILAMTGPVVDQDGGFIHFKTLGMRRE